MYYGDVQKQIRNHRLQFGNDDEIDSRRHDKLQNFSVIWLNVQWILYSETKYLQTSIYIHVCTI